MTLKTTNAWRETLIERAEKGFWTSGSDLSDICHDADEAERLVIECKELNGRLEHSRGVEAFIRKEIIADLRAKLNMAYEKAAQVCDKIADGEYGDLFATGAGECAREIRALKEQEKP